MIDTSAQAHHPDLLANMVEFSTKLRAAGLLVSPAESIDGLRAVEAIDMTDQQEFYLALRTVMISRLEDMPPFDEVFFSFWPAVLNDSPWDDGATQMEIQTGSSDSLDDDASMAERKEADVSVSEEEGEADEKEDVAGYSADEQLVGKDFSLFRANELEEMFQATLKLARKMATRLGRRMKPSSRSHMIDRRRTFRLNLKYGGDVIELAHKSKKIKKTKLVLLCDVSGSMDIYSRFLLQFIYAMQNNFTRTESFVFSTQLSRVTDYFKEQDIYDALDSISHDVLDWSGGTRIGQSLATFNRDWAGSVLDQRTIVIILSDGWDTGDAETLDREMSELERRAKRVIWLNPLMANAGYQPLCRGMRTALPHVEVFAPANNLASLMDLERHLLA